MDEGGLGPAAFGPLYAVLVASFLIVTFFIGKYQISNYYNRSSSPQVIGVSDAVASGGVRVLAAAVKPEFQKENGCFYKQFKFTGEITADGPGIVLYEWEGEENASMSVPLTFDGKGTKEVSTSWQVYGGGVRTINLHVYGANEVISPKVTFELECSQ